MNNELILSVYINLNLIDLINLNTQFEDNIRYKKIYYIDNLTYLINKFISIKNINNLIITNNNIQNFNRIYEYELTELFNEYFNLIVIEIKHYNTFQNLFNNKLKNEIYKCNSLINKSKFVFNNKYIFNTILIILRDKYDHDLTILQIIIILNYYKILISKNTRQKIKKIIKYICLDYNLSKKIYFNKDIAIKKIIKYINNKTNFNKIPLIIQNNNIIFDNMKNYKIIKIIKGFRKLVNLYRFNKKKEKLWEIAEYYTIKKYSPDNILKYIELSN